MLGLTFCVSGQLRSLISSSQEFLNALLPGPNLGINGMVEWKIIRCRLGILLSRYIIFSDNFLYSTKTVQLMEHSRQCFGH
jgi:hypothetical protein